MIACPKAHSLPYMSRGPGPSARTNLISEGVVFTCHRYMQHRCRACWHGVSVVASEVPGGPLQHTHTQNTPWGSRHPHPLRKVACALCPKPLGDSAALVYGPFFLYLGPDSWVEDGVWSRLHGGGLPLPPGDRMLMMEGQLLGAGGKSRVIVLVSGTSWSPKVSDLARCHFEDDADVSVGQLSFPFRCRLGSRRNRVANNFMCLEHLTSDEMVLELTQRFEEVDIFVLENKVINVGGTLWWSEVGSARRVGCLWRPGMKTPLGVQHASGAGNKSLELVARLSVGDPLANDPLAAAKRRPAPQPQRHESQAVATNTRARSHTTMIADGAPTNSLGDAVLDLSDAMEEGHAKPGEHPAEPLNDDDLDFADGDDGSLAGSEEEELALTYVFAEPDIDDPSATDVGRTLLSQGGVIEPSAEEASAFALAVEETFVEDQAPAGDGAAGDGPASAPSDEPASSSDAIVAPPAPWASLVGPSPASGYVYDAGRSIARIQRGKPLKRVTITCYRHPGCSVLVNEDRAPTDQAVFEWLFSMPAADPQMPAAERKELTTKHKASARAMWTAPKK